MRVKDGGEGTAPTWPYELLVAYGRYVYGSEAQLRHGSRMNGSEPLSGDPDSKIVATVLAHDPVLGEISTPFGRLEFLTAVGVTAEELAAMQDSSSQVFLDSFSDVSPLLITDPDRR